MGLSYDVVSFFFLTEFVTFVSRFVFSSFHGDEVTNEPCIAENKEPPNTPANIQACGMGALKCCVPLGIRS
jgi:hypothetical protein